MHVQERIGMSYIRKNQNMRGNGRKGGYANRNAPYSSAFSPSLAHADIARPSVLAAIVREHVKWSRAEGKYDRVGVEPPVTGHRFNECLLRVAEILERHERLSVELHRASAEISRLRNRKDHTPNRRHDTPQMQRNKTRKEYERT